MKTEQNNLGWKNWLMDVSIWPNYCFIPYETETKNVVFGFNLIQDKSPGKLIGIVHCSGQDFTDKWCLDHPNWQKEFSKT